MGNDDIIQGGKSPEVERWVVEESPEVPDDEEIFDGEEGQEEEFAGPDVMLGMHPQGGIALQVREGETTATAQMSIDEVWRMIGHAQALVSMLVSSAYAQAAMEQEQIRAMTQHLQGSPGEVILPPGARR